MFTFFCLHVTEQFFLASYYPQFWSRNSDRPTQDSYQLNQNSERLNQDDEQEDLPKRNPFPNPLFSGDQSQATTPRVQVAVVRPFLRGHYFVS